MRTSHKILSLFLLLSLSAGAGAHPPAKSLSQLLKSSFTAPRTVLENGALSAAQKKLLTAHFSALEETRRNLFQNPGWVLSEQFNPTARRLQQLNLPLPPKPPAGASTAEKEQYLQQLNRILYRESKTLGKILNRTPRQALPKRRLMHRPPQQPQTQLLSQENWEKLLTAHNPNLLWGTPNWDQVRIRPLHFSARPADPAYIDDEVWEEIVAGIHFPKYAFYDLVLQHPKLSPAQKQTILCAAEEAAALLTYEFVQVYMTVFGSLPQIEDMQAALPPAANGLETYAKNVQKNLILKLEKQGTWNEQEFEMFSQSSVYLEPKKAKAVLGAVTYLEPQAALWLLEHPLENPLSRAIMQQTRRARDRQDRLWPEGIIFPKLDTHINFKRMMYSRQQALKAYLDILWKRLQLVMDKQEIVQQADQLLKETPLPAGSSADEKSENLAIQIFITAKQVRLQKTMQEISLRIQQIDEELRSLQRNYP